MIREIRGITKQAMPLDTDLITIFLDEARPRSREDAAAGEILKPSSAAPFSVIIGCMEQLSRITLNPEVMGGKPCIRGMRVTVGTVVGLMAAGHSAEDILKLYPYLEAEDLPAALAYAAWRAEEVELPLVEA
jgi:uncharacterized protein (DUF433 family)